MNEKEMEKAYQAARAAAERRDRIATAALSALAQTYGLDADPAEMVKRAVRMADALIAEVDKETR